MSETLNDKLEFSNRFEFDSSAIALCEHLKALIEPWQRRLSPLHAIFAILPGYDSPVLVSSIFALTPSVIAVIGLDESGTPIRLFQHISRFDLILQEREILSEDKRSPIGFSFPE